MLTDPTVPILLFAIFASIGTFHALISKSAKVGAFWFIVCIMLLAACFVVIYGGN